jgi:hypothetical protein
MRVVGMSIARSLIVFAMVLPMPCKNVPCSYDFQIG